MNYLDRFLYYFEMIACTNSDIIFLWFPIDIILSLIFAIPKKVWIACEIEYSKSELINIETGISYI